LTTRVEFQINQAYRSESAVNSTAVHSISSQMAYPKLLSSPRLLLILESVQSILTNVKVKAETW